MPQVSRIPKPPPAGCLWIDEAATYIGVAKNTLYKWRQTGHGPKGFPVARRIAYRIEALDAWLAECEHGPAEPNPEMRPPEVRQTSRARNHRRTPAAA
ncbi:helix-turn-helix domain-containing protein [Streptomyces sp. NPDC006208]|uniref:helix-turn-helix transcriptional regulator n=1 Tax=Streptomyces sp. NPDC006208 TaxID=3156734 RepID=UPI0033B00C1E